MVGPSSARLVVLALEVASGLRRRPRSGTTPPAEEGLGSLEDAVGTLSCAAAKAVATRLLGLKCAHGADGDIPIFLLFSNVTRLKRF